MSDLVASRLHIAVTKVHDFSCYRAHHRIADHFRDGRAFLLGDAAHLHSPAGVDGLKVEVDGRFRELDVYVTSSEAAALFMKLAAQNFPLATQQLLN